MFALDTSRTFRCALIAFAASATAVFGSAAASAGVTQVAVGSTLPRFELLKPGVHRYVRYRVDGQKRTLVDVWTRRINVEEREGQRRLHITQRWDEVKPSASGTLVLEQFSWFELATFRPLTHVRTATRADGVSVKGYQFTGDKVVALEGLAQNDARGFALSLPDPAYNFEYDMELLQTLPLADGYTADLVFYDPGVDPKADHYRFTVAGSDHIAGWDGKPIDCWVVTADYNTGTVKSRFWIDKRSQLLIREEQPLDDGGTMVKSLLPQEAADASEKAS